MVLGMLARFALSAVATLALGCQSSASALTFPDDDVPLQPGDKPEPEPEPEPGPGDDDPTACEALEQGSCPGGDDSALARGVGLSAAPRCRFQLERNPDGGATETALDSLAAELDTMPLADVLGAGAHQMVRAPEGELELARIGGLKHAFRWDDVDSRDRSWMPQDAEHVAHGWVIGAEDVMYEAEEELLWSLSEFVGRRFVFSLNLPATAP